MELIITAMICITAILVIGIIVDRPIEFKLTVRHESDTVDTDLTQEDIDKANEQNKVPTFDDVIKVINEEFGGIDYED